MRSPGTIMNVRSLAVLSALCLGDLDRYLFFVSADDAPDGFDHTYVHHVLGPTDLEFLPDGTVLAAEKRGKLWALEGASTGDFGNPGSVTETLVVDLGEEFDICYNGERGLAGVTAHPNFEDNRFIYLFYAVRKFGTCLEDENVGPVNRVSRFRLKRDLTLDVGSELRLFDTPAFYMDHHNSGDMFFGKDGNLWVTVGDAGTDIYYKNPRHPDIPMSQSLDNFLGKILRLTDIGGIPPDNPYVGPDGMRCNDIGSVPADAPMDAKCEEIWASGLRNPFRFALDPNTPGNEVRFFINDVGAKTWEETSEGGLHMPGVDYGWPIWEGACPRGEVAGCWPKPDQYTDPIHWMRHGPDGGARTAGAFVPNGIDWPEEYNGAYMYADYVFGKIYRLNKGPKNSGCRECDPPVPDHIATTFTRGEYRNKVTSMQFGPWGDKGKQALYYVTRGWGEDDTDGLFRISFTGDANRAPLADILVDKTSGGVPLTVDFNGSGSTDPDRDILTYEWDFDGDGTVDSTDSRALFTYNVKGTFTAILTVTDPSGLSNTAKIRIDVDNMPPLPTIINPPEGATFAVGDRFTLTGSATDPEDKDLPDSSLSWEVRQHHAEHYHPFLDPTSGNDVPVQAAPSPEDFFASTNSYLEVRLTATDSDGLSATVSRNIRPKLVTLSFESTPISGLDVFLDGERIGTPSNAISWENHPLLIEAPETQIGPDGNTYSFQSWSNGEGASHKLDVPSLPLTLSVSYIREEIGLMPSQLRFIPTDDAVITPVRDKPIATKEELFVDLDNDFQTLIRFEVSGIGSARVASAKLRLCATNKTSDFGGNFTAAINSDWDENTVNTTTAPEGKILLGSLGPVSPQSWYEIDVMEAVTGDGSITFQVSSNSSKRAVYHSKNHPDGNPPELLVSLAPDSILIFEPAEDAVVSPTSSKPVNGKYIFADADNDFRGLILFNVTGVDHNIVTLATLRLYAAVKSSDFGGMFEASWGGEWDETTVNATKFEGNIALGELGPVRPDQWYEVDATEAILGDGTVTFEISSNSSSRVIYHSKDNIAGNVPQLVLSIASPPSSAVLTFEPTDDAVIKPNRTGPVYSLVNVLSVDLDDNMHAVLRFELLGIGDGDVISAVLRLYAVDKKSDRGGRFLAAGSGDWDEDTVDWDTVPVTLIELGSLGPVFPGEWYEINATKAIEVAKRGVVTFVIEPESGRRTKFCSKEHPSGNAPQLVITLS